MVRMQIQITEKQRRRLKAVARKRNVSVAAVIRECVDAGLGDAREERRRRWDRASRIVGAFSDSEGKRDIARRHDDYLDEAYR
jgi:ribosome maturation protein Sdo1